MNAYDIIRYLTQSDIILIYHLSFYIDILTYVSFISLGRGSSRIK